MELTLASNEEDSPVVNLVSQILDDALQNRASDVHFEPFEQDYRVRYRLDGLLKEIVRPPFKLANRISTRIKVLANLDITERRKPQDGRFQLDLASNSKIDCRVSTCPTIHGEKIVIRLLDTRFTRLDIEAFGLNNLQKELFLQSLSKPQGLILVTGPTGSGKTHTLYTALSLLNREEKNISSIEDPVEIKLSGINQVAINFKAGLTFSTILRALLRQDPDIIMVGEIRDFETAELAIKAAQTGHLVLSTLHTNSAVETLTRLRNLGIPSYNLASSLSLLVAQRLARKLCEHCKIPSNGSSYKAQGCALCNGGYQGRLGLFEIMPLSKNTEQLIMGEADSLEILRHSQQEGMLTLYQSALEKIEQGLTSYEEVQRIVVS
jgi:type IV pilus assembly protein PilB